MTLINTWRNLTDSVKGRYIAGEQQNTPLVSGLFAAGLMRRGWRLGFVNPTYHLDRYWRGLFRPLPCRTT